MPSDTNTQINTFAHLHVQGDKAYSSAVTTRISVKWQMMCFKKETHALYKIYKWNRICRKKVSNL